MASAAVVDGNGRGLSAAESELRHAFIAEVEQIPGGRRISRCLQCGTCTGSCPVSYAMDISPRELIARFRAGDISGILSSRSIWLCASCYSCTTRCPVGIKITDIIYAMKRLAMQRGMKPGRWPVFALAEAFTRGVRRFGRNHEPLLMMDYYRRASPLALLGNAGLAARLFVRGRLPLLPHRVRGIEALRRIMRRAEALEIAAQGETPGLWSEGGYAFVADKAPRQLPVADARAAARSA